MWWVASAFAGLVQMSAEPAFDGIVRDGDLALMRVSLENLGGPTTATVSVRVAAPEGVEVLESRRRVELADKARKVVPITYRYEEGVAAIVTVEEGGDTVEQRVDLKPVIDTDVTVGLIGYDAHGANFVRKTWGQGVPGRHPRHSDGHRLVHFGMTDLADLPRSFTAYLPLDIALWPSADPLLLPDGTVDAMLRWVADGGHLVLTVADTWRQVAGSPLAEALPVTLTGIHDASAMPLAPRSDPQPVATAVLREVPGRQTFVLARNEQGELLHVASTYGLGTVHVVLADPGVAPLTDADPVTLWRRVLFLPDPERIDPSTGDLQTAMHAFLPDWGCVWNKGDRDVVTNMRVSVQDALANVPGLEPLPLIWVATLAAVYLLAVGPLELVLLQLLRRRPWTWILFPLVATGFAAVVFQVTAREQSQATYRRVVLADVLPGTGLWRGQTMVGVFSPARADIRVLPDDVDGVVLPMTHRGFMDAPYVVPGTAGSATGIAYGAQTATIGFSEGTWVAPFAGGVEVRRVERVVGERQGNGPQQRVEYDFAVTNNLGFPLRHARLLLGWSSWRIDELADGEEVFLPARSYSSRGLCGAGAEPEERLMCQVFSMPDVGHGHLHSLSRGMLVGIADHGAQPEQILGVPGARGTTSVVIRVPFTPHQHPADVASSSVFGSGEPVLSGPYR